MGYKLRTTVVVSLMAGILFTVLFLVDLFFLQYGTWFVVIASLLGLGLQYLISPLIIGFLFRIRWLGEDEIQNLYPHIYELMTKTANQRNLTKLPRFGIIEDGNPNAFTYGWTKNSARLVITTGILAVCDEEEHKAVVGHELGHIVHQDFIVMTFINAIPIMFYYIYRILISLNIRKSGSTSARSGSGNSGQMVEYVMYLRYILVIVSYFMYIVGTLVALLLSRWREYWADEFSAEINENPDALATALVKIAYGILQEPPKTGRVKTRTQAVRSLGIFDKRSAKALAYSSTNQNSEMDMNIFAKAAAWDLHHPWAKYFEIMSTHPLPAKRIRALNDMNQLKYNQEPSINLAPARLEFKKQMGNSALDEFAGELFIQFLPNLMFFTWIFVGMGLILFDVDFSTYTWLPVNNIWSFLSLSFLIMGIGLKRRTKNGL